MNLLNILSFDQVIVDKLNKRRLAGCDARASYLLECVFSEVLPDVQLVEALAIDYDSLGMLSSIYVSPLAFRISERIAGRMVEKKGALTFRQFTILHSIIQKIKVRKMLFPFINYHSSYWYYYNLLLVESSGHGISYWNEPQIPLETFQRGDLIRGYTKAPRKMVYDITEVEMYFNVDLPDKNLTSNPRLEGKVGMETVPLELQLGCLSLTEADYMKSRSFWDFLNQLKWSGARFIEVKTAVARARPLFAYVGAMIAEGYLNNRYEEADKENVGGIPTFMREAMDQENRRLHDAMSDEDYSKMRKKENHEFLLKLSDKEGKQVANVGLCKCAVTSIDNRASYVNQGCPCCKDMVAEKLAREYAPQDWFKGLAQFKVSEFDDKNVFVVNADEVLNAKILHKTTTGFPLFDLSDEFEEELYENVPEVAVLNDDDEILSVQVDEATTLEISLADPMERTDEKVRLMILNLLYLK